MNVKRCLQIFYSTLCDTWSEHETVITQHKWLAC